MEQIEMVKEITKLTSDEGVLTDNSNVIDLEDGLETYKTDQNTTGIRRKWIDVNEKLPKNDEYVVVLIKNEEKPKIGFFIDNRWIVSFCGKNLSTEEFYKNDDITHYMTLPMTHNCNKYKCYNEKYDADYCKVCLRWFEEKCKNKKCSFCVNRPEKANKDLQ